MNLVAAIAVYKLPKDLFMACHTEIRRVVVANQLL